MSVFLVVLRLNSSFSLVGASFGPIFIKIIQKMITAMTIIIAFVISKNETGTDVLR